MTHSKKGRQKAGRAAAVLLLDTKLRPHLKPFEKGTRLMKKYNDVDVKKETKS